MTILLKSFNEIWIFCDRKWGINHNLSVFKNKKHTKHSFGSPLPAEDVIIRILLMWSLNEYQHASLASSRNIRIYSHCRPLKSLNQQFIPKHLPEEGIWEWHWFDYISSYCYFNLMSELPLKWWKNFIIL